ncbi:MAG: M1 family metallopeptidase [Chloroflexota bacterium]|nr:M1 family metallopeptidase [Chloroflexota bacterium]
MHCQHRLSRRRFLTTLVATPLVAALAPRVGQPAGTARALTLPGYRIEADVDLDAGTVAASQIVTLRNPVGVPLDSVAFRVVPASVGTFMLHGATVDGTAAGGRLDGSILELPLAAPLEPGSIAEIALRYSMQLPRDPNRLVASGDTVTLGSWFPILSVHRGDWDRRQFVDTGDANFSVVADYDVAITTSRSAEVAAPGQLVERSGTRWRFTGSNLRDFALAISPTYLPYESRAGEATVRAYFASEATSRLIADRAATFLQWLSDRLGPYAYPTLTIAGAGLPASFGGLEYPAFIILSQRSAVPEPFIGSGLDALLLHEVVHQWFYSIVGNDQIADPWLDEALTTYVTYLYYAEVEPSLAPAVYQRTIAGGGSAPVDSAVTEFASDPPYFEVVYRRGARFLDALHGHLGHAQFIELLRQYVAIHRDRIATPRAFLDLAQSLAGTDLNALIGQYFRYGAFRYPRVQAWTLETPPSPWSGSASVFVGAEFPISRVELWLDQRRMVGGPENALTLDLSGVEPGEYVLLARVFDHADVMFERARRVEVR